MAFTQGAAKARKPVAENTAVRSTSSMPKLHVGLVGAVAVEGLGPRHAGHRTGPLAGDRLGGVEHGLGHGIPGCPPGRRRMPRCRAGRFELAVGAQVLVVQAAGDLVVAVDAGHHQQLLRRAAGSGAARSRRRAAVEPAGHGELPGALAWAPTARRLHLDEALPVHGRPQGPVDRGPEPQVGLQWWAAAGRRTGAGGG